MSLLAYNKTTAPLPLAAGNPVVTLPAASSVHVRGAAYNVTGELRPNLTVDPNNGIAGGLSAADFSALQAQVAAGQVEYEWTEDPDYLVANLSVGSPPVDIADDDVFVYYDAVAGSDTNAGSLTAPVQTFLKAWSLLPRLYKKQCQLIQLSAGTYPIPADVTLRPPVGVGLSAQAFTMVGVSDVQVDAAAVYTVASIASNVITFTPSGIPVNKYGVELGALGGTIRILTGASAGQRRLIRSNTANTITPNVPFSGLVGNETFQIELPTAILNPSNVDSLCSFVDGQMRWLDIKWKLGGSSSRLNLLNGCSVVAAEGVEIDCNGGAVQVTNKASLIAGITSFPPGASPPGLGDTNTVPDYYTPPFSPPPFAPLVTGHAGAGLVVPCGVFLHDGSSGGSTLFVSAGSAVYGYVMVRTANVVALQQGLVLLDIPVSKNVDWNIDQGSMMIISGGSGTLLGNFDGKGTLSSQQGIVAVGEASYARLDRLNVNNSTLFGIVAFANGQIDLRRVGGTGNTLGGVGIGQAQLTGVSFSALGGAGAIINLLRSRVATCTGAGGDVKVGNSTLSYATLYASTGFTEPSIGTTAASGAAASVAAGAPAGSTRLTGLASMTPNYIGGTITLSGAATGGNNATFTISNYISATSVDVTQVGGFPTTTDANNGAISWTTTGGVDAAGSSAQRFLRVDVRP